jgi:hypothetical protein
MKVKHSGDAWVFHVESDDERSKFYVVDVLESWPNCVCSCTDYSTRCGPRYKATKIVKERTEQERTRCKHINAVVMFLGNKVINGARSQ